MRKRFSIPLLFFVLTLLSGTRCLSQNQYLPDFLQQKQVWQEKLIVLYAPENLQHLIKEQLNLMYPDVHNLSREKITIVHIPAKLTQANQQYMYKKLKVQPDRLNIWVIDEKGNLRMSSSKLTPVSQFMRVLNIEARPNAVARAQFLWD